MGVAGVGHTGVAAGPRIVTAMTSLVPVHPGPTNGLTDIAGIRVGHHERIGDGWLTGSTVVRLDDVDGPSGGGAVAGVDVRGGGPGTRETDLLDPTAMVERVHAISLSGGSAFGLAAADGVMRRLREEGVGLPVGPPDASGPQIRVPIVPGAVVFDLGRGGRVDATPDAGFGEAAATTAVAGPVALGVVGAATGGQVAGGLKGGIGSASVVLPDGTTVAALAVVNAAGSPVDPRDGTLLGARVLLPGDLAGLDGAAVDGEDAFVLSRPDPADLQAARERAASLQPTGVLPRTLATTLVVLATDATLTTAQCTKVAGLGQDGLARALQPAHAMVDGDTVFALSTTARPAPDPLGMHVLLDAAADVVTRAIVRGVLSATSVSTDAGRWLSYRDAYPSAVSSTGTER